MRRCLLLLSLPLALACGDPSGALDVVSDPSLAVTVDAGAPVDASTCGAGTVLCTGATICVDTSRDDAHCGVCGFACGGGERCDDGSCTPIVEPPDVRRWRCELHATTPDDTTPFGGHATFGLQLVGADDGDALSVWASSLALWAARYDASSASWKPTERLADFSRGAPAVAMTPSGDALIVWVDGGGRDVMLRRFDAETETFGPIELLATDPSNTLGRPIIEVNERGDAILVWHWRPGSPGADEFPGRYWARVYDAASNTWSDPELLDTAEEFKGGAQAAIEPNGDALVVWAKPDFTLGDSFVTNRYDADSGLWSGEQRILPIDGELSVGVAVAPSGDAILVYVARTPVGAREVHWSRYDAATDRWETAELLGEGSFTMSARPDGTVRLVRTDAELSLWGMRYDPEEQAWTDEGLIASTVPSTWRAPFGCSVSSNAAGEAVVTWNRYELEDRIAWTDIWASHYDPETAGWTEPELIEAVPGGELESPQVVLEPGGNAVAAWRLADVEGNTMTWVNNFR